jgi:hypothetical protein
MMRQMKVTKSFLSTVNKAPLSVVAVTAHHFLLLRKY